MNKAELIKEVSKVTGFKQVDITAVVDAINSAKIDGLKRDGVVKDGLFVHKTKDVPARIGRNPKTGEEIQIEAKTKVVTKNSTAVTNAI